MMCARKIWEIVILKLTCGKCGQEKLGGLFSPAQRRQASVSQRICMECVKKPRTGGNGWKRYGNSRLFAKEGMK